MVLSVNAVETGWLVYPFLVIQSVSAPVRLSIFQLIFIFLFR